MWDHLAVTYALSSVQVFFTGFILSKLPIYNFALHYNFSCIVLNNLKRSHFWHMFLPPGEMREIDKLIK